MTDLDIQELANLTAGDADVDNFERLFTKLKEMKGEATSLSCLLFLSYHLNSNHLFQCKDQSFFLFAIDKASSLPHEQRKVHAEKVRCIDGANSQTTK